MTKDNELNISKEEISAGKIKDETVSEMAKMAAKQIYWQGFNAGIEAASEEAEKKSHILLPLVLRIRSLKK